MNKTEKLICLLLGAFLAWYIFSSGNKAQKVVANENAATEKCVTTNQVASVVTEKAAMVEPKIEEVKLPQVAEELLVLKNDDVELTLTSWGAAVKSVTLKKYAKNCGDISEENPAVTLDYSASPLGRGEEVEAFKVVAKDDKSVTFKGAKLERKISLGENYQIIIEESGELSKKVSLGVMRMGDSKNDQLSVDSWAENAGKDKPGVIHHGDDGDSPLKPYLAGGLTGGCSGCSGASSAQGMDIHKTVDFKGAQSWIALKNRFFVTALVEATQRNQGFTTTITRDEKSNTYRPENILANVEFTDEAVNNRKLTFFVGPKKQSLLWDLGMRDVMEFGMWRWLCYPIVWVLNLFNDIIPNFGVAIILLTILVRILFWPLTHKSTVGMRKMQEIQPLMKEIQKQHKDNPQRMQQEIWQLYREKKVNPLSSCLPMLIQIPVFIALFNVLRSSVELRYAPFLWISDLSEPEALLAGYFPFSGIGGLNILPILMAVTTALQSAFTPSTGDKNQQKMMMVFMPIMMLVMFYSFPSALSLYWFLSNLFSIVQMWMIRRETAKKQEVLIPEVIDAPVTRQMRRHG